MFPTVRVSFSGIRPDQRYAVLLDIVPVDNKRYRWVNVQLNMIRIKNLVSSSLLLLNQLYVKENYLFQVRLPSILLASSRKSGSSCPLQDIRSPRFALFRRTAQEASSLFWKSQTHKQWDGQTWTCKTNPIKFLLWLQRGNFCFSWS